MSDAPQDAASLILWFTATEIVRHNGTRDDREPMMTEAEARMLARKIGEPSHYGRGRWNWTAEGIWETALAQGLFMGDAFGWIDRSGRFWSCGYAAHELLLHFLGVDISEAEAGGWIRVSMSGVQTMFTPSTEQIGALILRGLEGAAKNLVYEGIEPKRADVKAARVQVPNPPMRDDPTFRPPLVSSPEAVWPEEYLRARHAAERDRASR